jgi:hypothetical protein
MKNKGIICYATAEDRQRLAAVVQVEGSRSGSAWLLEQIQKRYAELFGDLDPSLAAGATQ